MWSDFCILSLLNRFKQYLISKERILYVRGEGLVACVVVCKIVMDKGYKMFC